MGCGASSTKGPASKPVKKDQATKVVAAGGTSATLFVDNNKGRKIIEVYKFGKKSEKLGEGSYGSVSKAEHKETGKIRAVKTISKAQTTDPNKLSAEIAVMKMMDHPNICKLFETFEDARNVYLVMELCEGGELFDRIIELNRMTERQAAIVMQNMFRALFYMHSVSVCHRDLKPENFLFTDKKPVEEATLKLIDFGLARGFKKNEILRTKAGTPFYVAPEVLTGKYGESSDLWSLGVIMFVLLCGYPPFHGQTDDEVLRQVKVGKLIFEAKDWQGISDDAKELVRGLLTRTPTERLTADQALNHIWTKEHAPKGSNSALQTGTVDNLRSFRSQNKLKKAALQVIAGQLKEDQIKALREAFMNLDENGDGLLSLAELKVGLDKAGLTDIAPELKEIMSGIDADGSGVIDYTEFLAASLDKHCYVEEDVCWQAFRVFDKDGSGKISKEELSHVIADDGVKALFAKDMEALMKEVDMDGDGEIDFQEFMQMMRK